MPKLVRYVDKDGPVGWMHWCPGCKGAHAINVEKPRADNGAKWSFDGSMESPTFGPSIRIFRYSKYNENGQPAEGATEVTDCHYFIKAGKIEFCGDSRHALAGQTVDLPPAPDHWTN